jgi:hypothetical protein
MTFFTANYSFSGSQCLRRQRDNLRDRLRKSQDQVTQSFGCANIGAGCACVGS